MEDKASLARSGGVKGRRLQNSPQFRYLEME